MVTPRLAGEFPVVEMLPPPLQLNRSTNIADLHLMFISLRLDSVVITDDEGGMIGVLTKDDLKSALEQSIGSQEIGIMGVGRSRREVDLSEFAHADDSAGSKRMPTSPNRRLSHTSMSRALSNMKDALSSGFKSGKK